MASQLLIAFGQVRRGPVGIRRPPLAGGGILRRHPGHLRTFTARLQGDGTVSLGVQQVHIGRGHPQQHVVADGLAVPFELFNPLIGHQDAKNVVGNVPLHDTPGMLTVPAATARLPRPAYIEPRFTLRMVPLACCKLPVWLSKLVPAFRSGKSWAAAS